MLKQRVGMTDIEVVYSRPGVKGRTIFGGLVPYGQVWRAGANAATTITFSTAVKLNGTNVPAGVYALFTIPGEKEWIVILNTNPKQWGAYQYKQADDFTRIKAAAVALADPVETFLIDINDIRDDSATLNLAWEKTRVTVKIEVDVVSFAVPKIEAAMAAEGPRKPYFQAAQFYFEHGLDLQKARAWIDTALAEKANPYGLNLKAKILEKLGDNAGAVAAAKRALELNAGKDAGLAKAAEELIARLK